MRYAGQNYELRVAVPEFQGADFPEALRRAFEVEHWRMYGYIAEEEPVQLVTFRLQATGIVPKSAWARAPSAAAPVDGALLGHRAVYLPESEGHASCPVYDRTRLGPGHGLVGPAVVEQMDATTLVLPGQSVSVDEYLNLVVEELPE